MRTLIYHSGVRFHAFNSDYSKFNKINKLRFYGFIFRTNISSFYHQKNINSLLAFCVRTCIRICGLLLCWTPDPWTNSLSRCPCFCLLYPMNDDYGPNFSFLHFIFLCCLLTPYFYWFVHIFFFMNIWLNHLWDFPFFQIHFLVH